MILLEIKIYGDVNSLANAFILLLKVELFAFSFHE